MMRSTRVPLFVATFVVLLLASQQALQAASPGPDASAESKSYDVTATSRSQPELTGTFEFVGDPDRPQRNESGDFNASLATSDNASAASGTGTWWSRSFWFFSFWLAQADSADTEFQMFAVGVVWKSDLYGTLYVYGGTDVAQGRYRLTATMVEEPTEPTPTTDPTTTTE